MKDILITDTHFGVYNNSMTWWKHQADFIYNQFIPFIKAQGDCNIIHLGDLLDIRSSVNTFIATELKIMFKKLAEIENVHEIIVLAGNHDFYSPNDDQYCSIDVLLCDIPKIRLVLREVYIKDKQVFAPWYVTEQRGVLELAQQYSDCELFVHSDITGLELPTPVYSGHIHTPKIRGNMRNLGALYPLTFADSNTERYFYVLENGKLEKHVNDHCIRFWRLYDEELLGNKYNISNWDYIEAYISTTLLSTSEYQEKIKEFTDIYKNFKLITKSPDLQTDDIDIQCDFESIIESHIPDDLKDLFETIKGSL